MGTPFRISPASQESRFRQLLDPARREIETISILQEVDDALAEIRRVESVAERRRLALVAGELASSQPDEVFDLKGAAAYLVKSPDWLSRNKEILVTALISPPGARQQFSKKEIDNLRRRWARGRTTR